MATLTFGNFSEQEIPDQGSSLSTADFYGFTPATIVNLSITLYGLEHTYLDDIDMLLVAPGGQNLVFFSDIGGGSDAYAQASITVSDSGTYTPPDQQAIDYHVTWKPTAYGETETGLQFSGAFLGGTPAQASPTGGATFGSIFGRASAAGQWSLFTSDDDQNVTGRLAGWSLKVDIQESGGVSVDGDRFGATDDVFVVTSSGIRTGVYQLNDMTAIGYEGFDSFRFNGKQGNDTFLGSGFADAADGGPGRDTIRTREGPDYIYVRAEDDVAGETYDAGSGADELYLQPGASNAYVLDLRDDTVGGIESLIFRLTSNQATATVRLKASQVGTGIASNAVVTSSYDAFLEGQNLDYKNSADRLEFTMGTATQLDLSGMTFRSFITSGDGVTILGDAKKESIIGSQIADRIDGGGGGDTLRGGGGGDTYLIRSTADTVVEAAGQGSDTVFAGFSYSLAVGVSVEVLGTGNGGGTAAIDFTGNEFAQSIIGNAGANRLSGGGATDVLQGLAGNDTYVIDAADIIVEAAGQGTDTVFAGFTYALASGVSVEVLGTGNGGGTAAIDFTGNEVAQTIAGNNGMNRLDGKGAADVLQGLGGNDTYVVDASDTVVEAAGGGTDTIYAGFTYALGGGVSVEVLATGNGGGTAAINFTGNEFAQTITGNAGANRLDGRTGLDTLQGLAGNDTFRFTTAPAAGNVDTILDFANAGGNDDRFELASSDFGGLPTGQLSGNLFAANASGTAADSDDRIVYNTSTGALFLDTNGSGAGGAIQFATLTGAPTIANTDFLVS